MCYAMCKCVLGSFEDLQEQEEEEEEEEEEGGSVDRKGGM